MAYTLPEQYSGFKSKQSAGSTPISPSRLKRLSAAPPNNQVSSIPEGMFLLSIFQIAPSASGNASAVMTRKPFLPNIGSVVLYIRLPARYRDSIRDA